jgi:hypothetical protein
MIAQKNCEKFQQPYYMMHDGGESHNTAKQIYTLLLEHNKKNLPPSNN